MTFLPQTSLTESVCEWCRQKNKMTCSGAKCCHFSAYALGPSQQNGKPPDTEGKRSVLPALHVSHMWTQMPPFFPGPLHPFDTQKKKFRSKKKYLETWASQRLPSMLWVCVCVCVMVCGRVDRFDRGLIFYSWKWCPHPAISVRQSHWVSITGFEGIKITQKGEKTCCKKDVFHVWSDHRLACRGEGSRENWHTCD